MHSIFPVHPSCVQSMKGEPVMLYPGSQDTLPTEPYCVQLSNSTTAFSISGILQSGEFNIELKQVVLKKHSHEHAGKYGYFCDNLT